MRKNDKRTVEEFLDSEFSINNPMSVTLTSREWDLGMKLDEISLQRDITFFLNRLNYRVFRKRYSKFGKKLGVLPVIEGGTNLTQLHTHLLLELPDEISIELMSHWIRECWGKTKFGRSNDLFGTKVEIVKDIGWRNYLLKTTTKPSGLFASIDWINLSSSVTE